MLKRLFKRARWGLIRNLSSPSGHHNRAIDERLPGSILYGKRLMLMAAHDKRRWDLWTDSPFVWGGCHPTGKGETTASPSATEAIQSSYYVLRSLFWGLRC